jgi:hypothetical protein
LHPKKRLIRDELVIDTHTLRGQAIDKSGVASVTVNGQAASLDKHGYFTFELQVELGKKLRSNCGNRYFRQHRS